MTKLIILLLAILASAILVASQTSVRARKPQQGGGWYNITITDQAPGAPKLVKIIYTDENGAVLFQTTYDDAIEYYDGHMTSLITREGFSFRFDIAFGCYRRCLSTSLIRGGIPLLTTFEYPTCGGIC